jgi:hypothetical protein
MGLDGSMGCDGEMALGGGLDDPAGSFGMRGFGRKDEQDVGVVGQAEELAGRGWGKQGDLTGEPKFEGFDRRGESGIGLSGCVLNREGSAIDQETVGEFENGGGEGGGNEDDWSRGEALKLFGGSGGGGA